MSTKVDENILKAFPKNTVLGRSKAKLMFTSFAVVVFGVLAGFLLSKTTSNKSVNTADNNSSDVTVSEKEAGVGDDSSFPDTATGILVEGGIKGEGTHHLERPGGESQNVYLSSTVINLQSFVGKKVEVRGQTLSAVTAGWLMDVGKIKVVN